MLKIRLFFTSFVGPAHDHQMIICNSKFVFQALRAANAMFSIEEIESIMDDTAEAVEKQQEIDALLSGQGRFSDYSGLLYLMMG